MVRTIVAMVALAVLFPGPALADSDGYYCVGRGFVAYETSFSKVPGGHLLHIVRVTHGDGISELPPIALEEFQVHGITCGDTEVVLQGWTHRYSVDVSGGVKPTVTVTPVPFDQSAPLAQANLGMLAKPGVVDIPSDGAEGEFQIVIAQTSRRKGEATEYYTVTQIVQRDAAAAELRQIVGAVTLFNTVQTRGGEHLR